MGGYHVLPDTLNKAKFTRDYGGNARRINKYVEELKAKGAIKSALVERALRKVQRHKLL